MEPPKLNTWMTIFSNLAVLLGIFILIFELDQNTTATEADVAWSHQNMSNDIYYSRVENPEILELVLRMRSWDEEDIQALPAEPNLEYLQVSYLIGTEFGYWQTRYFTQTSVEDRLMLEAQIKWNGNSLIYRYRWVNRPDNFYRAEFKEFMDRIYAE